MEKKIGVKLALKSPEDYMHIEELNATGNSATTDEKYQFSAEMSVQQAQDSIISAVAKHQDMAQTGQNFLQEASKISGGKTITTRREGSTSP